MNKFLLAGVPVDVVDTAMNPATGDLGFAVMLPNGQEELVCAGLLELATVPVVNPSQLAFPALGAVELSEQGRPDVLALRGEKIPKYKQLSDLLGVPVQWEAKGRVGFYIEEGGRRQSLGYGFSDALEGANRLGLGDFSPDDIEIRAAISDQLKWGAPGGDRVGNPKESDFPGTYGFQVNKARALLNVARSVLAVALEIWEKPEFKERAYRLGWGYLPTSVEDLENRFDVTSRIFRDFEYLNSHFEEVIRRSNKVIEIWAEMSPDPSSTVSAWMEEGEEGLFNPGRRTFPPLEEREGMIVQSVIFPIDSWDAAKARGWLKDHGFRYGKKEEGVTVLRYRQESPDQIEPGSWATVQFGESGIQAVVGIPCGGLPGASECKAPVERRKNPQDAMWGIDESGRRVLYAREVGPTKEDLLSRAAGAPVRYYFPGDGGSPDPSRGGFWSGDRYLGRSFGEAYGESFGAPWEEIERGLLDSDLGKVAARSLSSGGSVLSAVRLSAGDFSAFASMLTEQEADLLGSLAVESGFDGGLKALHTQLSDTLQTWEESEGTPFEYNPKILNPPRFLRVVGKTGPLSFSVNTDQGLIEGSADYRGLEGLISGPDLGYQEALSSDLAMLEARDFSTAKEAWQQFEEHNLSISQALQKTERSQDTGILTERDRSGVNFEGVRNLYERPAPLRSLEETVKYIVNKEGVRNWDEFPINTLLDGLPYWADWLQAPPGDVELKADRLAFPELALTGGRRAVDRELDRLQGMAIERFKMLRSAYEILSYLEERGLVGGGEANNIRASLEAYTSKAGDFGPDDFEQFAGQVIGAIDYAKGEIPF